MAKMVGGKVKVGEEDMCNLIRLDQDTLLENLRIRYDENIIYTFTGGILVSVNPYQELPIYTHDTMQTYSGKIIGELPPHLYAVADAAYQNMRRFKKNQSVLISGESGSGKTEATNRILHYLAVMTQQGTVGSENNVRNMILQSGPVLEAFGNAKTVRNNNSSRFGKFVEVWFGTSGQIIGAKIIQYLLEKSRLVHQAPDERNYHVFYMLVNGTSAAEKEKYKLLDASKFHYLNQSNCTTIEGLDEEKELGKLTQALNFLNISVEQQAHIFQLISSVLHLGNIKFTKHGDDEAAVIPSMSVDVVCEFLQIKKVDLEEALVKRKISVGGQEFKIPLKVKEATDNRDAMAKALYGRLFTWIVDTINARITAKTPLANTIGILDIFGFENFKQNSFEQFCINFANEKLQQHFNQHIFKIEQEEYSKEKIDWSNIEFKDNQDTLDLIEKKPIGLLHLIDEESRFPKGTDETLLQKLHTHHGKHPLYVLPRAQGTLFGTKHYAGVVMYDVRSFLDKNRDTLLALTRAVCLSARNPLVREIFYGDSIENDSTVRMSVSAQFKDQLNTLMKILSSTNPLYIRCIKPNSEKAPSMFDNDLVLAQLRYSGMLETIRIRQLGYPVRYSHSDFMRRYGVLVPRLISRPVSTAVLTELLKNVAVPAETWRVGVTRVFLRDQLTLKLEQLRNEAITKQVIICQKTWRMWRVKKVYLKMRRAALVFQTRIRRIPPRQQLIRTKKAALTLQTHSRMLGPKKEFLKLRHAAELVQASVVSARVRAEYLRKQQAIIVLQTAMRVKLGELAVIRMVYVITRLQAAIRAMFERRMLDPIIAQVRAEAKELAKKNKGRRTIKKNDPYKYVIDHIDEILGKNEAVPEVPADESSQQIDADVDHTEENSPSVPRKKLKRHFLKRQIAAQQAKKEKESPKKKNPPKPVVPTVTLEQVLPTLPPETQQQFSKYSKFCERFKMTILPADFHILTRFVTWYTLIGRANALEAILEAITTVHKAMGLSHFLKRPVMASMISTSISLSLDPRKSIKIDPFPTKVLWWWRVSGFKKTTVSWKEWLLYAAVVVLGIRLMMRPAELISLNIGDVGRDESGNMFWVSIIPQHLHELAASSRAKKLGLSPPPPHPSTTKPTPLLGSTSPLGQTYPPRATRTQSSPQTPSKRPATSNGTPPNGTLARSSTGIPPPLSLEASPRSPILSSSLSSTTSPKTSRKYVDSPLRMLPNSSPPSRPRSAQPSPHPTSPIIQTVNTSPLRQSSPTVPRANSPQSPTLRSLSSSSTPQASPTQLSTSPYGPLLMPRTAHSNSMRVPIDRGANAPTCPVTILEEYISSRDPNELDAPLFAHPDTGERLTEQDIDECVKHMVQWAGSPVNHITGLSLRIAGAANAAEGGLGTELIMAVARERSDGVFHTLRQAVMNAKLSPHMGL